MVGIHERPRPGPSRTHRGADAELADPGSHQPRNLIGLEGSAGQKQCRDPRTSRMLEKLISAHRHSARGTGRGDGIDTRKLDDITPSATWFEGRIEATVERPWQANPAGQLAASLGVDLEHPIEETEREAASPERRSGLAELSQLVDAVGRDLMSVALAQHHPHREIGGLDDGGHGGEIGADAHVARLGDEQQSVGAAIGGRRRILRVEDDDLEKRDVIPRTRLGCSHLAHAAILLDRTSPVPERPACRASDCTPRTPNRTYVRLLRYPGSVPIGFQPSLLDAADEPRLGDLAAVERSVLSRGAWVDHLPGWVGGADAIFTDLVDQIPWRAEQRPMYERVVEVPRLVHTYGIGLPLPHPLLASAREALNDHYRAELGEDFVTAGCCFYRDGADSVAWHGDNLGRGRTTDTMVAIVSFGSPRRLLLRPRGGSCELAFHLGHGDLVVMGGSCQRTWEHAIPKTARPVGPRISIQFRPRNVF